MKKLRLTEGKQVALGHRANTVHSRARVQVLVYLASLIFYVFLTFTIIPADLSLILDINVILDLPSCICQMSQASTFLISVVIHISIFKSYSLFITICFVNWSDSLVKFDCTDWVPILGGSMFSIFSHSMYLIWVSSCVDSPELFCTFLNFLIKLRILLFLTSSLFNSWISSGSWEKFYQIKYWIMFKVFREVSGPSINLPLIENSSSLSLFHIPNTINVSGRSEIYQLRCKVPGWLL